MAQQVVSLEVIRRKNVVGCVLHRRDLLEFARQLLLEEVKRRLLG